ncbi:hypothetical protein [Clostridium thermobutyricum]|uniref:hypothetical protein n=1 Tax=Clostridium thermobutyricum TaxID=29372 RepID=UPI0018AC2BF5|nr:hypothetical protein [Clostridium thermobutyricum]
MIKIDTNKNKTELEVKGDDITLKAEATATIEVLAMMIAAHEHTDKLVVLEEMVRAISTLEDMKINKIKQMMGEK